MKRVLLVGAMLLLATGIATIVALGWLIGEALPALLAHVTIDGRGIDVGVLTGTHWLLLGIGIALALAMLALMLPLLLAVAVGLPLLVAAVVTALLLSPLLLLGWGLWKLGESKATIG
jgi:hypothetical protein